MTKFMTAGAALLMSTSIATAGGLDRSGQSIGAIFEEGTYAELSFGMVMPSVTGTFGAETSGNMAQDYFQFGGAFKQDINDAVSFAIIIDQPFGAAIDYTGTSAAYPVQGPLAEIRSTAVTVLGRYEFNDRISVHGGLRYVTSSATVDLSSVGSNVFEYEGSSDVGYVLGAAYEIPDIALRAALTYSSETTHTNDVTVSGFPAGFSTNTYTLPQSVNLDFQTGIAENTLLLAGVRWADWTETEIQTNTIGTIDYGNDSYTYSLGIARRFNDQLAGLVRVSYEDANGGEASNLAPTDGSIGITLGAIYDVTDQMTITAGLNYTILGDATTENVFADFSGNSAIGLGMKVGYNF